MSDLIGAYPEHETDHGTTLYPTALVGGRISPGSGSAIRLRQLALEGFMSRWDAATLAIEGEQIDPYAPQLRSVPNPVHALMLPNHGRSGDEAVIWASVRNDP